MTNRYPLVIDTQDSNKIKELPNGDNLNLTGNGIVGVENITSTATIAANELSANTISIAGETVKSVATSAEYSDLLNAPAGLSDLNNDINALVPGSNISTLTNDSNYLSSVSFAQITGKPITIAGYGITDALTVGSSNSLLVNDAGYLKASDLQNGVITVDVNNTGDLIGSVFADDSTTMIDSVLAAVNLDGTIRGNVTPVNDGVYNIGTGAYKFNSVHANSYTGDLTGSVFADNSSLLVDAVNGTIPGYISIATLKAEVAASADFADFQTRIAAL